MKSFMMFTFLLFIGLGLNNCTGNHSKEEHQSMVTSDTLVEEQGQKQELAGGPRPMKLELPDHLRIVLRTEMREIEGGMGRLLSHLVQGNGNEAAEVAESIHNSFILKRELSEQDLKLLVSLLPEEFVKLDRRFHQSAANVAHAAKQGDFASAIQGYSEMAQACVTCHAQFATERFPALNMKK